LIEEFVAGPSLITCGHVCAARLARPAIVAGSRRLPECMNSPLSNGSGRLVELPAALGLLATATIKESIAEL
jgi:hypothetical protein